MQQQFKKTKKNHQNALNYTKIHKNSKKYVKMYT